MVVNDEKAQFAERLNQACDLAGIPSGRGRRADLARMFNVSGESARKWLSGESIPKSSRVVQIALRLGVNGEWLLTGRGEMRQAESASPTPNTEPGPPIRAQSIGEVLDQLRERLRAAPDDVRHEVNQLVMRYMESDDEASASRRLRAIEALLDEPETKKSLKERLRDAKADRG